ncbi:acetylcholine receptor subunit alpha-like isoform X1 [Drosophila rhopaloa]|uniref:Neurotransmitter-gated ion-channel ligand-binding domain-containing protein n=2 Tax=Drosophila rhopaloa TaxID=1041015 RepID=A0ABM5JCV3_DRORH|nr:acetylcholine receptor subunit alpha-like isoform X1 [Drosophila rhopaloa]
MYIPVSYFHAMDVQGWNRKGRIPRHSFPSFKRQIIGLISTSRHRRIFKDAMKFIIEVLKLFIRKPSSGETFRAWILSALMVHGAVAGNPDAKRLYDDLLSNYNKLVRPVVNTTDVLKVCIKLKLSQLIDVNLKNQIMTTNLWVEQSWYDYKLRWEPKEYGGVHMLHVPSDHIWRPDIVLYNK